MDSGRKESVYRAVWRSRHFRSEARPVTVRRRASPIPRYSFQPSIPDAHFFGSHYNYAPVTMWLRQRRPGMEHIISSVPRAITCLGRSQG